MEVYDRGTVEVLVTSVLVLAVSALPDNAASWYVEGLWLLWIAFPAAAVWLRRG